MATVRSYTKTAIDAALSQGSTGSGVVVLGSATPVPNPPAVGTLYVRLTSSASADTTAPSIPGNRAASNITSNSFTVTWSASSDDVAVTGYEIRLNSEVAIPKTTLSHTFTGLTANTNYNVTIRAGDAAGNWSAWSSALVVTTATASNDVTAPTVPSSLTVSSRTTTNITVSWTASTDAVGVIGYESRIDSGSISSSASVSRNFAGLNVNSSHTIEVRAYDAAGNRSAWASITASTLADTTAPSIPGNRAASSITSNSFTVTWSASSDDVAVTGYEIRLNSGAAIPKTTLSHTFTSLTADTNYNVTIRAGDAAGNWSAWSSALVVTTAAPAGNASIFGASAFPGTVNAYTDGPARIAAGFYTTLAGGMDVVGARIFLPTGAAASFYNTNITVSTILRNHTAGTGISAAIINGGTAQNPFAQPLAPGWNTVLFANPIHVNPYSNGTNNAIWIATIWASGPNYLAVSGVSNSSIESTSKPGIYLAESNFPQSANGLTGGPATVSYPIDILVAP